MERSLLYTSRKTISPEAESAEIEEILRVARSRNAAVGITGALINSTNAFAQLLEGPADSLHDLMEQIDRDPRHENVQILRLDAITRRKLPGWTMAYSGSSTYVAARVEVLVGAGLESDPRRIDSLAAMLVQFARANPDRRDGLTA